MWPTDDGNQLAIKAAAATAIRIIQWPFRVTFLSCMVASRKPAVKRSIAFRKHVTLQNMVGSTLLLIMTVRSRACHVDCLCTQTWIRFSCVYLYQKVELCQTQSTCLLLQLTSPLVTKSRVYVLTTKYPSLEWESGIRGVQGLCSPKHGCGCYLYKTFTCNQLLCV